MTSEVIAACFIAVGTALLTTTTYYWYKKHGIRRRAQAVINAKEKEALIQEGRNQVLYLLLVIGDEYVAHDNLHPDKAHFLYEVRKEIVKRLKLNAPHYPSLGGNWPEEYPDFENFERRQWN